MKQWRGRKHRHLQVWLTCGQWLELGKPACGGTHAHARTHTMHARARTQCTHCKRPVSTGGAGGEPPRNPFGECTVAEVKQPRTVLTWGKCSWFSKCPHERGLAAAYQEPWWPPS